jgi:hypothetical protein
MPRPASWASAVALYLFASGVRAAFALVMPILVALMRHSPRLAWLGMLLLWISPIAIAAAIHDLVGRLIGVKAPAPRDAWLGSATSWWAGFVAWATIIIVTMTMAFVVLIVDPPPVVDPDSAWNVAAAVTRGVAGTTRALLWLVLAAYVYEIELRARRAAASSPDEASRLP